MDGQEIPTQMRLDKNLERIDQMLAQSMQQYDQSREELVAEHPKGDAVVEKTTGQMDQIRARLEPVVFEGQAPGKSFAQDSQRYLELLGQCGDGRLARRIAFPATQKPGEVPMGEPLGGLKAPAVAGKAI